MEISSPPNYAQALQESVSPTMTPINQAPTEKPQEVKVVVKSSDMNEGMQAQAIQVAKQAIQGDMITPREIAGIIKKEFDRVCHPSWHCIVGRSFGSFVTHEAGCFIFFYVDQWAILLFKTA